MAPGSGTGKQYVDSDRLLLVEGKDETNLLNALIRECTDNGAPPIQVIEAGGRDQFAANLRTIGISLKARPTFRSIGVIRDADDNPKGAFQSVCAHLQNAGYAAPPSHGTFSNTSPSVGVFIVPGGDRCGAIETLCRCSVMDTAAARCVEQYLQCLETHNAMASANSDKSFVHAYLASTRNPVARVGEGAQGGVWNFSSPAFREIRNFVCSLI